MLRLHAEQLCAAMLRTRTNLNKDKIKVERDRNKGFLEREEAAWPSSRAQVILHEFQFERSK